MGEELERSALPEDGTLADEERPLDVTGELVREDWAPLGGAELA